MSPQFDEVLLTAYLDDEVTEEERARVVEELRTSEASRKLLEELRSVRNLVVQLHLSPPTRRFEHGPWNSTTVSKANAVSSPIDTPRVVLDEARWYRRVPFQRLASLAALIAIAICASSLMIGPNTRSISQSGSTKSDKSVDAKSLEKFGNDVQLEFAEADNLFVLQPKEVGGATAMVRGRDEAKKDYAAALPLEETRLEPQDALATRGSGGNRQLPESSRATRDDSTLSFSGRPANQPDETPSPALSKPTPSSQSFELGNGLAAAADSRADFSLQVVEEFEELDRSKTPERNEFSKRFFYRYEVNKLEQQAAPLLAEKTDATQKELQLLKSSSITLGKKQSTQDTGIESESILVEFQIPINNWVLGASRLRKLGMEIPEKLPTAEFLEFTATPIETTTESLIDQFGFDLKEANATVASNWRFFAVAPQEKAKIGEDETRANEPAGKVEKDKQKRSSPPAIQIRVRPIK